MVNNKHVFWQALILAILVFWTGLLFGSYLEGWRADKIEKFYFDSETDIFDIFLQNDYLAESNLSCDIIENESIILANQIYEESKILEKYDSSSEISTDLIRLHKRYDLLRTMLWQSIKDKSEKCEGFEDVVVYFYQYDNPEVDVSARQKTFERILSDLKEKRGNSVILIPIAYDSNTRSLSLILESYSFERYPAVLINEEFKIYDPISVEELESYLDRSSNA